MTKNHLHNSLFILNTQNSTKTSYKRRPFNPTRGKSLTLTNIYQGSKEVIYSSVSKQYNMFK